MDPKPAIADDRQIAAGPPAASPRVAPAARAPIGARTLRLDGPWQASSFDLAQGCDVKEMQSKLSPETLDQLFRS